MILQRSAECANVLAQEQEGVIALIGGGEDSSYSAEIEQVAEQENNGCSDIAICANVAEQAQVAGIELIGSGEYGTYSAEIEQVAEQENNGCSDIAICANAAVQVQAVDIVGESWRGTHTLLK